MRKKDHTKIVFFYYIFSFFLYSNHRFYFLLSSGSLFPPPFYIQAPISPPSRKGQASNWSQQSMENQVEVGPHSSPCSKAGQIILALGTGFKMPPHVPGPGPNTTARDSINRPSYTTITHIQGN